MLARPQEKSRMYHYADYKTILSPKNGMNIYRGCTHGCIYCDSRSDCYQIGSEFEDIEVKRNAPEILRDQLSRRRSPCMVGTGAMCDPYIPLEEELEMTRQCLCAIEEYGFGATVLTKSSLILRDLDVLSSINEKSKCVGQVTLTTYDEDLCRKIEPAVSTTIERVGVLDKMRDKGIPTVVWLSPCLPFINDSEENLQGLLKYCLEVGVKGILCFGFGVTMRAGNREYFYQSLDRLFPGTKEKYMKEFGLGYVCDSPNTPRLLALLEETCEAADIMYKPDEVFSYLKKFESCTQQMSLF